MIASIFFFLLFSEIKGKKCSNAGSTTRLGSGVVQKESLPGFDLIIRRQKPSMESFYTSIFKSKTPTVLEGKILINFCFLNEYL